MRVASLTHQHNRDPIERDRICPDDSLEAVLQGRLAMRRSIIAYGLAAGLLALGACGTLGKPVTLSMAELDQRCDRRGGTLQPTGAATGRPQADYICHETKVGAPGLTNTARASLNRAVDQGLRQGY